jgi:CBS-domain-containing membrane protein
MALSDDKLVGRIRERSKRLVREFMIPIQATIDYDDHMMKIITEMVDRNTSLLPVLEDGNVVGVVRSVDVLNEISLVLPP